MITLSLTSRQEHSVKWTGRKTRTRSQTEERVPQISQTINFHGYSYRSVSAILTKHLLYTKVKLRCPYVLLQTARRPWVMEVWMSNFLEHHFQDRSVAKGTLAVFPSVEVSTNWQLKATENPPTGGHDFTGCDKDASYLFPIEQEG